ncbi:phospholipase-like protein [Tanacetum coccineum]
MTKSGNFAHHFGPNQSGAEFDYDSEDMEEEVEYMTDDEVVMDEQEESNHGNTKNIQHFEEKDDVDRWLNAEITKHMSMQGVENTEDALISIIKSIKMKMRDDIMKKQIEASTGNIGNETSSIASNEVDTDYDNISPTASCLLPKELSPGSFILLFNIDDHNLYAITTLEAKDNIMSLDDYKYLVLDKLRDAGTVENTTGTNEPLGAIDILVKFGTLEFLCNFVIKMVDDVIILGRPFLESTHAQIDVFNEEISFEIGSEKFKLDINSHQCIEKIYIIDMAHEEETFYPLEIVIDLFSYESPACLEFEQRSRSYGTPNPQDEIAKPISFSPDRRGLVKRWHVYKPIHVTYDTRNGEDYGMWPACDPDSKFYFGYNEKIDDTTRERRYYEWVAQNYEFSKHHTLTTTTLNDHFPYDTNNPIPKEHLEQEENEQLPIRPRPCNYSFEEWLKIRIGHNNLHESDRKFIFNEWILDSYDVEMEYAREIGDPYSRRFDEYNRVFKNEIEHLSNEYIIRIGKIGYVLDDVWEKCQQNYKKINEAWHDKAYVEDEMCFICITDRENEALPLGRVNGARFKVMIKKELKGNNRLSLPPQPIGEATKASNLRRIPPGVQERSQFTYFLYLVVQITNPFEEGIIEAIRDTTMEEYMMKTREDYGSGIARPKIDEKAYFELKGQFLKELRDNTYKIKKVNERVYAAQVGCESCNRPHYTKDYPLKEDGKTFEEAYYTQFGVPFPQGGRYRAAAPGFYQRNNRNPSYQERRQTMEESLRKFMAESAKTHDKNSNLIKEIRASMDVAIRNQGASINALEI